MFSSTYTMTSTTTAARTVAIIVLLTLGLVGLEHAASTLLALLRGLAVTARYLLLFTTSIATVGVHHLVWGGVQPASEENVTDLLFEEDSIYPGVDDPVEGDYYTDSEESISFSLPPLPPGHHSEAPRGPAAPRSLAPSPSSVSYDSAPRAPSIYAVPEFTQSVPSRLTPNPYQFSASVPKYTSPMFSPENRHQWFSSSTPTYAALEHQPHQFGLSAPAEYRFAPRSSFLFQYIHRIPKSPQLTQYTYSPSAKRLTRHHSLGASEEDARFPIASGLAFPNAIPTTTPPFYSRRHTTAYTSAVLPATQSASRNPAPNTKIAVEDENRGTGADTALSHPCESDAVHPASPPPIPRPQTIPPSPPPSPVRIPQINIIPVRKGGCVSPPPVDSAPAARGHAHKSPVMPKPTSTPPAAYVNPMLRGGRPARAVALRRAPAAVDPEAESEDAGRISWADKGKWAAATPGPQSAKQDVRPVMRPGLPNNFFAAPASPTPVRAKKVSGGGAFFPLVALNTGAGGAEVPAGFVPLVRR
ncbi:hypothetical protein C8R44DRAFT_846203 [Mycena epipterygia]|nr:hypothetical protein C8R44DRAFT_846203 [Mycena epipterygia]